VWKQQTAEINGKKNINPILYLWSLTRAQQTTKKKFNKKEYQVTV
jgi:hypothetical protein